MKIALCGIHEEVNTFAVDTMGLATVTGNMATGFQRFKGQATIDAYTGEALMRLLLPWIPAHKQPGESSTCLSKDAALILVDGNPLEKLDLIVDHEKNFVLIMKGGKIFRNTVPN